MNAQSLTVARGELNWQRLNARLRAQARQFLQWWTGELRALVPPQWRGLLDDGRGQLVVEPDGGLLRVALCDNAGMHVLALLDPEPGGATDVASPRNELAAAANAVLDTVVRLPANWLIERVVVLPVETEERLDDVLRFELDRLTPFRPENVCFAYTIMSRDTVNRTIELLLMVITRERLERLLARLEELGIRPSRVVPAEPPPQADIAAINLLPDERRPPTARGGAMLHKILGVLASALFVATLAVPIMHYRRAVSELDAAVTEISRPAEEALRIQRQVSQLEADAAFFAKRRTAQPAFVDVLRELTMLLPDDTWLSRLELSDGRVTLQGESANASALIGIVEGSPRFRETAFAASVTRSRNAERDLFSLQARVEPGEAAQ